MQLRVGTCSGQYTELSHQHSGKKLRGGTSVHQLMHMREYRKQRTLCGVCRSTVEQVSADPHAQAAQVWSNTYKRGRIQRHEQDQNHHHSMLAQMHESHPQQAD